MKKVHKEYRRECTKELCKICEPFCSAVALVEPNELTQNEFDILWNAFNHELYEESQYNKFVYCKNLMTPKNVTALYIYDYKRGQIVFEHWLTINFKFATDYYPDDVLNNLYERNKKVVHCESYDLSNYAQSLITDTTINLLLQDAEE